MTDTPTPCERCGKPHALRGSSSIPSCAGHIKSGPRKGEPCGQPRLTGLTVCRRHGGGTRRNRAAGRRRVEEERLGRSLMGGEVEPVVDVVAFAQERLGRLAQAVDSLDAYVGSLTDSDGGRRVWTPELQAQLAAQTALLREARRWSTDLARLGLEDRAVAVLESQAEQFGVVEDAILAGVLVRVLRALAASPDADPVALVEREWPVIVAEVVPAEWLAIEQGGK